MRSVLDLGHQRLVSGPSSAISYGKEASKDVREACLLCNKLASAAQSARIAVFGNDGEGKRRERDAHLLR
jgi:hypothetical protein